MSLNQCSFIGNLGADPEIKEFSSGDKICNLRIAVSEKWKDKNTGERKERTEWVSIVINGALVGVAEKYLRKGSKIFIQGQMRTRKWQDRDGNDRYTTEVSVGGMGGVLQMLDGKPDGERQVATDTAREHGYSQKRDATPPAFPDDLDDEIPF